MSVCYNMSLCSAAVGDGTRKDKMNVWLRTQSNSHIEGCPSPHADVCGRRQRPSVGCCGFQILRTPAVRENRPGRDVGVCRLRTSVLGENMPRALRACSVDIAWTSAMC